MLNVIAEKDGYMLFPVDDFTLFTGFLCGDSDLDDFLQRDARIYHNECISLTYGLSQTEDDSPTPPLAFATLLNSAVPLPQKMQRSLLPPRCRQLPLYPAVKLERFGVHQKLQRQGLGNMMLHLIVTLLKRDQRVGYRLLVVDAYTTAMAFYEKFGFMAMGQSDASSVITTRPMFLDLARYQL